MKEPLYRQAFVHSWKLAWQHKFLWVFGLFAAFLGQMGILELLSKVTIASSDYALNPKWLALPKLIKYMLADLSGYSLPVDGWIWMIWLAVIVLGACIVLTFLSVTSQGALVYSAAQSVKDKNLPDSRKSWHVGVKHFWRLFFLNLVKKIVMVLLSVAAGYGALNFVIVESGWGLVLFLLLFLLTILVGMVLSFLVIYAAGYVVVEEYSLGRSIEAAWKLFSSHRLVSLEVGLLVLLSNFALGAILVFAFIVLFFPTLLSWFVAALTANIALYAAGTIVGVILFTLFLVSAGSVFVVFTTTVWTYLFMKMHKVGIKSRILHWGGHYKK